MDQERSGGRILLERARDESRHEVEEDFTRRGGAVWSRLLREEEDDDAEMLLSGEACGEG